MFSFLLGTVFGVAALWAFLEWREWNEAGKPDDNEDDDEPGGA